jgi:serine/threonine-protein phosphatase 6 regulatory ankyrin repeat subunit B
VCSSDSIVEALHWLGAEVDIAAKCGTTPLSGAASCGHVDVAEYLLKNGADVNSVDSSGSPPLYFAAVSRNVNAVKVLVDHGADMTIINNVGTHARLIAASNGDVNIIKLLKQHGGDVRMKTPDGVTTLIVAAQDGQLRAAEFAISNGVSLTAANDFGSTALHFAARNADRADMIRLLVDSGAVLEVYDSDDNTPLLCAIGYQHEQNAAALVEAGASVTQLNRKGLTTLFAAIERPSVGIVTLLLQHGATAVMEAEIAACSQACCGAVTALMHSRNPAVTKLLLAAGADVHRRTSRVYTCLHVAAAHKHPAPVVCLLIKAGADLHAMSSNGKTAAMVAHDAGNSLVEALLIRAAQQSAV